MPGGADDTAADGSEFHPSIYRRKRASPSAFLGEEEEVFAFSKAANHGAESRKASGMRLRLVLTNLECVNAVEQAACLFGERSDLRLSGTAASTSDLSRSEDRNEGSWPDHFLESRESTVRAAPSLRFVTNRSYR